MVEKMVEMMAAPSVGGKVDRWELSLVVRMVASLAGPMD